MDLDLALSLPLEDLEDPEGKATVDTFGDEGLDVEALGEGGPDERVALVLLDLRGIEGRGASLIEARLKCKEEMHELARSLSLGEKANIHLLLLLLEDSGLQSPPASSFSLSATLSLSLYRSLSFSILDRFPDDSLEGGPPALLLLPLVLSSAEAGSSGFRFSGTTAEGAADTEEDAVGGGGGGGRGAEAEAGAAEEEVDVGGGGRGAGGAGVGAGKSSSRTLGGIASLRDVTVVGGGLGGGESTIGMQ